MLLPFSLIVLAIWLGLLFGRGGFWRIERQELAPEPIAWPSVVAVIPARNEAQGIGETVRSLLRQEYPGGLRIVVVDDHSDDGTAAAAIRAASDLGRESDLCVIAADPLPQGWVGKVWAMHQGVTRGLPPGDSAAYILFSDADITHGPDSLVDLISRAEAGGLDLASFMVRLQCHSAAERLIIPAFVFFFRMLYPFRWVNDPSNRLAAAAGGTMLVRREALDRIGCMESIRHALIDDCVLAAAIKRGGHRIWLGLSDTSSSTRSYGRLSEIVAMIARTAYTQLGRSPFKLAVCVIGLAVTFLAPPILFVFGTGWVRITASAAWLTMSLLYLPMVRFYRQSPLWAPLLPITASIYLWATLISALNHHRGKGGAWKGRFQQVPGEPDTTLAGRTP